jgi:cytochrome c biogenesis protein CcmG, thiol:disulfide interchange protein DsbE
VRKFLTLLPLAGFIIVAGYFALALNTGRDPHELPSALIDQPAPDFALPPLSTGGEVSLAGLRGQVVVVNFFASWCVPCRIEHPLLMRLANQDHVALVGIAYKDPPEAARKLLGDAGNPYRVVGQDLSGRTGIDFGVYGVPETYVIDRTGRIRRKFVGPLTPEAVNHDLLPLLRQLERS